MNKWTNGHWRYRVFEFAGVALIVAPLGRLQWWQLLGIIAGLVVVSSAATAECNREGGSR